MITPSTRTIKTQETPDFVSPFVLGCMDAEEKLPCIPEMYFTKSGDMCEFCEGYESIAGETLTTSQFLRLQKRLFAAGKVVNGAIKIKLISDANAALAAQELEDAIEDEEWIRRGC